MLSTLRDLFLNPRSKRFWALFLFLTYTVAGFFLAPYLVKQQLVEIVRADYQRELSIKLIAVNPFSLTVSVQGLELKDPDDVVVASFGELFVNLQVSGLFRGAWTFDEISVREPYFFFERFSVDDNRLVRLLETAPQPEVADTDSKAAEPGSLPRLLIYTLAVTDGQFKAIDHTPGKPVTSRLESINIVINDLNTIPDRSGSQEVEISMPGGGLLAWSGQLELAPLRSQGHFRLSDINPKVSIDYIKEYFHLRDMHALVSADFDYEIAIDDNGDLTAGIDSLRVDIEEVELAAFEPEVKFLAIDQISLRDGKMNFPAQEFVVGRIEVVNPMFRGWMTRSGLNLTSLLPETATDPSPDAEAAKPWRLSLDELVLTGGDLTYEDRTFQQAATVDLDIEQLSVSNISTEPGTRIDLQLAASVNEGKTDLTANLGADSDPMVQTSISFDGVDLSPVSSYLSTVIQAELDSAQLSGELEIAASHNSDFEIAGAVALRELNLLDGIQKQKLLAWEALEVDRFEFGGVGGLNISNVSFTNPFARVAIDDTGQLNVTKLIVQQDAAESSEGGAAMPLTIGRISVSDGELDFSDASLALPFSADVRQLRGNISTISSETEEPASVELEGQVNEFGMSRISGSLRPFDPIGYTDLALQFRNLTVSNYSPYSASFAGREIAAGKLELGLAYHIESGQLKGDHDIVLSDLTLGDKVDHPDAANLPLGLAVSLLKDADGVIDIDLPVSGDMNDPEFAIGGVVFKAFANLITKLVAAPFKLLGGLIGVDSEDLGSIEFEPGRSDLTPPEREKIINLITGLDKRPQLSVVVLGLANRELDEPVLKYGRLRAEVIAALDESYDPGEDMLDEQLYDTLSALFVSKNPTEDMKLIEESHRTPPPDDPEGRPRLDRIALMADLRDRMLAAIQISDSELLQLASDRAVAIQTGLTVPADAEKPLALDTARVTVKESRLSSESKNQRVVVELTVE